MHGIAVQIFMLNYHHHQEGMFLGLKIHSIRLGNPKVTAHVAVRPSVLIIIKPHNNNNAFANTMVECVTTVKGQVTNGLYNL